MLPVSGRLARAGGPATRLWVARRPRRGRSKPGRYHATVLTRSRSAAAAGRLANVQLASISRLLAANARGDVTPAATSSSGTALTAGNVELLLPDPRRAAGPTRSR